MPLGSDSKERRKSLKEYAKMHAQARDAIQQPVDDNAPYYEKR